MRPPAEIAGEVAGEAAVEVAGVVAAAGDASAVPKPCALPVVDVLADGVPADPG
jgi:hypothetical protein